MYITGDISGSGFKLFLVCKEIVPCIELETFQVLGLSCSWYVNK